MAGSPAIGLLRARLLGTSEISVGDRILGSRDWPGRKARSLLLLILAARGHQVHRDQALDALWPDLDPDAGANALYKALHALRRTLEPGLRSGPASSYIATHGETISIAQSAAIWIDVAQFSRLLAQAETVPPAGRRAPLREALALYRGEFVADELYADWPVARREALRAEFEGATLQLARLDLEAGEPLHAIPVLEAMLAQDATAEAAHRALMQAYLASGQRTLALRQFERCRDLLQREYDVEPEAETVRLAESIRAAAEPAGVDVDRLAAAAKYGSLPAIPTRTVGRDADIAAVRNLLADPCVRMVTLTGTGGIGKTRLATEVGFAMKEVYPDGITFVPLASIRDPDLLFPAIGAALRITENPRRPIRELVTGYFQARSMLLILDNMEQVTLAGREVAALLETCPGLVILATSRAPLRIRAERIYRLGVLDMPGPAATSEEALAGTGASALFLQALTAMHDTRDLDPADLAAIAEICMRLDGLPLAIELAAARCQDLTPREVLALLNRRARITVLRDGPQDLPDRHQTLHDLVRWSYDLLSEPEQALFRRLAVFAGGVEPDALKAIGGDDAPAHASSLADQNLVQWVRAGGTRRLLMLETIREVAAHLLADAGEGHDAHLAHATFFATLAIASEPALRGRDVVAAMDRCARDVDNLRAALGWTLQPNVPGKTLALDILAGTALFWLNRGHTREGLGWLEAALDRGPGTPGETCARCATWAAIAAFRVRDEERWRRHEDRARECWRALGTTVGEAWVHALAARRHRSHGAIDQARHEFKRALARFRDAGDSWGVVDALMSLSTVQLLQGHFDDAMGSLDEALAITDATGDLLSRSFVLNALGDATVNSGDLERGMAVVLEDERVARMLDNRNSLSWALYLRAIIVHFSGDHLGAIPVMRQAIDLFIANGEPRYQAIGELAIAAFATHGRKLETARAAFQTGLPLVRASGYTEDVQNAITDLGHFARLACQPETATRLFAASAAWSAAGNDQLPPPEVALFDAAVAALKLHLGPRAFDHAWAAGSALSLDEALDLAEAMIHGRDAFAPAAATA